MVLVSQVDEPGVEGHRRRRQAKPPERPQTGRLDVAVGFRVRGGGAGQLYVNAGDRQVRLIG